MPPRPFASLVLIALASTGHAQAVTARPAQITELRAIDIKPGVNLIDKFTPDGRDAMIVKGFRAYITADGAHNDYFVLTHTTDTDTPWTVVTAGGAAPSDAGDREFLSDDPHTGEDQVKSIRFARARLNGSPATVLIEATREFQLPIPSASRVKIEIYNLEKDKDAGGDAFVLVQTQKTKACYTNSDLALSKTLNLALPADYEGPTDASACGAFK
jgi:hypothetical protein